MDEFVHQRHQPPGRLSPGCKLILACPQLQSNVNLSRIVRVAGCCGVQRLVTCGPGRIDPKIARDAAEQVPVERHRSLSPTLRKLAADDYQLVGLEQTTNARCLWEYPFAPRTVLVIGHERRGLERSVLALLDAVVEIPMFGMPHSLNVATATAMALYEYCRQHATE